MFASQAIRAGDADLFVAGGFESMSRAPYLVSGRSGELKFGNQPLTDALLYDGLWDPFENWGMGNAAEFIADEYEVTREAMDQYALRSHQKAVEAQEKGRFAAEIVPVQIPGRKGEVTTVERDDGPRKDTSLEALAKLNPAFKPDGKVTPGNSSPMNDGGAAVIVSGWALYQLARTRPVVAGVLLCAVLADAVWQAGRRSTLYNDSQQDLRELGRYATATIAPTGKRLALDVPARNAVGFYMGDTPMLLEPIEQSRIMDYSGGYIAVGGASSFWWSREFTLRMPRENVPSNWILTYEVPGQPRPWRESTLRVYYVLP